MSGLLSVMLQQCFSIKPDNTFNNTTTSTNNPDTEQSFSQLIERAFPLQPIEIRGMIPWPNATQNSVKNKE